MKHNIETDIIASRLLPDDIKPVGNSASVQEAAKEEAFSNSEILNDIYQNIQTLDILKSNDAFRQIRANAGLLNHIKTCIKKVIRKFIKWYLEPICVQQSEFNNAVLHISRSVLLYAQEQTAASNQLKQEIQALNQDIQTLQKKTELQETAIRRLFQKAGRIEGCLGSFLPREENTEEQIHGMEGAEGADMLESPKNTGNESKGLDGVLKAQEEAIEKIRNIVQDIQTTIPTLINVRSRLDEEQETLSQCGEDIIIGVILTSLGVSSKDVSYLDLGANHAKKYSNTYSFYKRGGHGVLVEANPELIPELLFCREKDTVLHRCVSPTSGHKEAFYTFSGHADGLSTMNEKLAKRIAQANPQFVLQPPIEVDTITVNELMETYFPQGVSLLNIDLEGSEMPILRSMDFKKYRPLIIVIEMINFRPELVIGEKNEEALVLLNEKGYIEFAFTGINSIFIDKRQLGGSLI